MSNQRWLEGYRVRIILLSPTRIGAGAEGNLQQVLSPRLSTIYAFTGASLGPGGGAARARLQRLPVIPASSLKGLLRSLAERIAASIYHDYRGRDPSSLSAQEVPRFLAALHHQPTYQEEEERRRNQRIQSSPVHAYEEPPELDYVDRCAPRGPEGAPTDWRYEAFASRYCPICLLFGSNFQAGAIRLRDAIPEKGEAKTTIRTHVSIDRGTRTKSEAKLYTEELVEAGTVFVTKLYLLWPLETPQEMRNNECMELYNAAIEEARRLWNIVKEYLETNEVQIGGGKTIGHGAVKIELES